MAPLATNVHHSLVSDAGLFVYLFVASAFHQSVIISPFYLWPSKILDMYPFLLIVLDSMK